MLFLLTSLALAADSSQTTCHGPNLDLPHYESGRRVPLATVLFLSGDGGWRGRAIEIARMMASWGYEVYGFDVKSYLEKHSQAGSTLSLSAMAADIRNTADTLGSETATNVLILGWSQGAGMALAAVFGDHCQPIAGVLTLGLPETAVLGWNWRATLAMLTGKAPNEPTFAVRPLLDGGSGVPVWMIYGSADEYTPPARARALYQAAHAPKQFQQIEGANHRFDGHLPELYRSIKEGLSWICATQANASAPPSPSL